MANRTHHPEETTKRSNVRVYAAIVGAGTSDGAPVDASTNGDIVTAVRSGAGKYTLVLRHKYFALVQAPVCSFIGTTDGLVGMCSAFDPVAGTGALEIYVGSTPTDLATTDTVYLAWTVRNSSRP